MKNLIKRKFTNPKDSKSKSRKLSSKKSNKNASKKLNKKSKKKSRKLSENSDIKMIPLYKSDRMDMKKGNKVDSNSISASNSISKSNKKKRKVHINQVNFSLNDYIRFIKHSKICEGVIKYIGNIDNKRGTYIGVEYTDGTLGKHDGCIHGVRYFQSPSNTGAFIKKKAITKLIRS